MERTDYHRTMEYHRQMDIMGCNHCMDTGLRFGHGIRSDRSHILWGNSMAQNHHMESRSLQPMANGYVLSHAFVIKIIHIISVTVGISTAVNLRTSLVHQRLISTIRNDVLA